MPELHFYAGSFKYPLTAVAFVPPNLDNMDNYAVRTLKDVLAHNQTTLKSFERNPTDTTQRAIDALRRRIEELELEQALKLLQATPCEH